MKRALIIVWEFPPGPGGIGQHAYSIAYTLCKKGFSVQVITSADYVAREEIRAFDLAHSKLKILRPEGSRISIYIKRILYSIRAVISLRHAEIIFSGKGAVWLLPWLKLLSSSSNRLSVFIHGSEVQLPERISRMYTSKCFELADRIYCVSPFTKGVLPERIRNSPRCQILVNGLITEELPDTPFQALPEVKLKGSPRLLTVGQLTKRKGQHRVIKALPGLRMQWPDIHYHMVGLDTDRDSLVKLANKLGVEDCITIHGRVSNREDLFKFYASADVFIMLSENQTDGDIEGFGIAILEANYFGVPAVGATGCGIEAAIKEGENGFLVDGGDVKQITEAIDSCLKKSENMKPTMREWVKQHNWDELIDQFLR